VSSSKIETSITAGSIDILVTVPMFLPKSAVKEISWAIKGDCTTVSAASLLEEIKKILERELGLEDQAWRMAHMANPYTLDTLLQP